MWPPSSLLPLPGSTEHQGLGAHRLKAFWLERWRGARRQEGGKEAGGHQGGLQEVLGVQAGMLEWDRLRQLTFWVGHRVPRRRCGPTF